MPKVLIIIPAFNEAETIGGVLGKILSETEYRDVLVINDGSADGTSHVARNAGVRVIDLPYNLGIGAAVQTGYRYAERHGYDYVVRIDADGQHEITQIPDLLSPLTAGETDLVIGSRVLGEFPYKPSFPRAVGIKLLSFFISWLVRKPITDTTSGFRAANRRVISALSWNYPDDYPEVESIISLHRMGFRVKEVGIKMTERVAGESSITVLRSVYYMVKVVFAVLIELLRKVDKL